MLPTCRTLHEVLHEVLTLVWCLGSITVDFNVLAATMRGKKKMWTKKYESVQCTFLEKATTWDYINGNQKPFNQKPFKWLAIPIYVIPYVRFKNHQTIWIIKWAELHSFWPHDYTKRNPCRDMLTLMMIQFASDFLDWQQEWTSWDNCY